MKENEILITDGNTTSNIEPIKTPYAFDDDIEEILEKIISLSEVNYKDFKKDSSRSLKHKINDNIKEINRQLRLGEQLIDHAMKLKNETNSDRSIFLKQTTARFSKIAERMKRLQIKLREFNK